MFLGASPLEEVRACACAPSAPPIANRGTHHALEKLNVERHAEPQRASRAIPSRGLRRKAPSGPLPSKPCPTEASHPSRPPRGRREPRPPPQAVRSSHLPVCPACPACLCMHCVPMCLHACLRVRVHEDFARERFLTHRCFMRAGARSTPPDRTRRANMFSASNMTTVCFSTRRAALARPPRPTRCQTQRACLRACPRACSPVRGTRATPRHHERCALALCRTRVPRGLSLQGLPWEVKSKRSPLESYSEVPTGSLNQLDLCNRLAQRCRQSAHADAGKTIAYRGPTRTQARSDDADAVTSDVTS